MPQYLFVGIIRGNVSVLRSKKSKNNIFDRIMQIIMNIKNSILYYVSSGKCMDTFRIALTENRSYLLNKNIAKTVLATYFIIIL